MLGFGDGVVVLLAAIGIIYGIYMLITKKLPLYFQLSVCAVGCLMLGYIFDICDYIVNGMISNEYFIGYLGSIGSFLFLLTAKTKTRAAAPPRLKRITPLRQTVRM
mgnify:CR=1 FL=1